MENNMSCNLVDLLAEIDIIINKEIDDSGTIITTKKCQYSDKTYKEYEYSGFRKTIVDTFKELKSEGYLMYCFEYNHLPDGIYKDITKYIFNNNYNFNEDSIRKFLIEEEGIVKQGSGEYLWKTQHGMDSMPGFDESIRLKYYERKYF